MLQFLKITPFPFIKVIVKKTFISFYLKDLKSFYKMVHYPNFHNIKSFFKNFKNKVRHYYTAKIFVI